MALACLALAKPSSSLAAKLVHQCLSSAGFKMAASAAPLHAPGRSTFRLGVAWLLMCASLALHVTDEALTGFLAVYNPTVLAMRAKLGFWPMPPFELRVAYRTDYRHSPAFGPFAVRVSQCALGPAGFLLLCRGHGRGQSSRAYDCDDPWPHRIYAAVSPSRSRLLFVAYTADRVDLFAGSIEAHTASSG
jgi:hypothetical protein